MPKQKEIKTKDTSVIPEGSYCHGKVVSIPDSRQPMGVRLETPEMCPYWTSRTDRPKQEDGYCKFLEKGDGDDKIFLLWDQVKACGINEDDDLDDNEF